MIYLPFAGFEQAACLVLALIGFKEAVRSAHPLTLEGRIRKGIWLYVKQEVRRMEYDAGRVNQGMTAVNKRLEP